MPISYSITGQGIRDGVNALIYTIIKYFIGTPNITTHIRDYLNNL